MSSTSLSRPELPVRQMPRFVGQQTVLKQPRVWSDGSVIDRLPDGWVVRETRPLSLELHLFALQDEHGVVRSWFADRSGRLLARRPERLSERMMRSLQRSLIEKGPIVLQGEDGPRRVDSGFLSELVRDPLVQHETGAMLRDIAGALHPLVCADGTRLARLDPGWSARLLFTGFRPLLVLELVHVDGGEVAWYLDDAYRVVDVPDRLDPVLQSGLRRVASAHASPDPDRMDPGLTGYVLLGDAVRAQLERLPHGLAPNGAAPAPVLQRDLAAAHAMLPQAAMATTLVTLDRLEPGSGGFVDRRLSDLWFVQDGFCLCRGDGADIAFTLPYRPSVACLALELRSAGGSHEVTVSANGWRLARFPIDGDWAAGARRDIWVPGECLTEGRLRFELSFDASARTVVCSLEGASLEIGPPAPEVAIPPAPELMGRFGSLGVNCEFGFVQRHFGIEPLGLFRFAGFHDQRNLIRLIDTDFAGMGEPGSLSGRRQVGNMVQKDGSTVAAEEWFIDVPTQLYGFHTWQDPALHTLEATIADNERKLAYLARAMVEDLEDGEKIWVFKETRAVSDQAGIFSLHRALNRHRPNRLFWITRPVEGRPAGAVEWIAPNLLRGYSGQSHVHAQTFDAGAWHRMCADAYRAFSAQTA